MESIAIAAPWMGGPILSVHCARLADADEFHFSVYIGREGVTGLVSREQLEHLSRMLIAVLKEAPNAIA